MLRAFFDFGSSIGWEAAAVSGITLIVMLFAGLTVEHVRNIR